MKTFETFNPPITLAAKDLKCGDICIPVFMKDSPHNTCTVKRINAGHNMVELYRPYTHFDDVQYAGPSIICYTGVETFSLFRDETPVFVLERHTLR
jgi:hypothetical protein